ncbi:MAG: Crp/Fnr family transcriptional regulator [Flavobacteriales bacterium]|nr:Crp/Fnr family transcriptional regulator [Flavobacteriales bacterium]
MEFIHLYRQIVQDQAATLEALPFAVRKVEVKKGTVITAYGAVEKRVYFIRKGIIELSIEDPTAEKVLDFFFENEVVTCLTSFLLQSPSDVQMTALTDCELECFDHDEVYSRYPMSLEVNKLGRVLVEQAYLRKARREKDLLSRTAEEMYMQLLGEHTEYVKQIPVSKLARYLGIHPESLSRIRKRIVMR